MRNGSFCQPFGLAAASDLDQRERKLHLQICHFVVRQEFLHRQGTLTVTDGFAMCRMSDCHQERLASRPSQRLIVAGGLGVVSDPRRVSILPIPECVDRSVVQRTPPCAGEIRFDRQGPKVTAAVAVAGAPVADLTISDYSWSPVSHLYQSFMKDGDKAYLAKILMEGGQSEHEEETGLLRLHEHAFNRDLVLSEVSEIPFRELWMRDGMQTFDPLIQLETA